MEVMEEEVVEEMMEEVVVKVMAEEMVVEEVIEEGMVEVTVAEMVVNVVEGAVEVMCRWGCRARQLALSEHSASVPFTHSVQELGVVLVLVSKGSHLDQDIGGGSLALASSSCSHQSLRLPRGPLPHLPPCLSSCSVSLLQSQAKL